MPTSSTTKGPRQAGDALRAAIRSEAAARESTTSPPEPGPPSITAHVSRVSRRWLPLVRCLVCGAATGRSRRVHNVSRHEHYRREMYRYRRLLRATVPRLAYHPKPSTSPRAALEWGVRVLSSGEVQHVVVRPASEVNDAQGA